MDGPSKEMKEKEASTAILLILVKAIIPIDGVTQDITVHDTDTSPKRALEISYFIFIITINTQAPLNTVVIM